MTFALELTVRMVGAALFGAAIGYEREVRGKGAGVRTHLLVALGSALFTGSFPQYAYRFTPSSVCRITESALMNLRSSGS